MYDFSKIIEYVNIKSNYLNAEEKFIKELFAAFHLKITDISPLEGYKPLYSFRNREDNTFIISYRDLKITIEPINKPFLWKLKIELDDIINENFTFEIHPTTNKVDVGEFSKIELKINEFKELIRQLNSINPYNALYSLKINNDPNKSFDGLDNMLRYIFK